MQKYFYVVIGRTVQTDGYEVEIFQRHAVRAENIDEATEHIKGYMDTFWDDTRKSRERNERYPRLAKYYSPGELDMSPQYAYVDQITEMEPGDILKEIIIP